MKHTNRFLQWLLLAVTLDAPPHSSYRSGDAEMHAMTEALIEFAGGSVEL